MAYNRPTLTEIHSRILDDIDGRIPGADSRLRRSFLSILARIWAGAIHSLYGLLDFWALQIIFDRASSDNLARHAANWSVGRNAATRASGTARVSGIDGSIIEAGSLLIGGQTQYRNIAAAVITGGTADIAIEAVDAGVSGNSNPGVRLQFSSPIAGVNAAAIIISMGGGNDEENDDSLRGRLSSRIAQPPHGGNANDYVVWARSVAGVTRAWVSPNEMRLGTVSVRFVMDNRDDIFPNEADILAVQNYIDEQRPVTAAAFVLAPMPVAQNFIIRLTPPSEEVRAAVREQLSDLLRREAEPGGTILISHIREAISLAAGEIDHDVIQPSGDIGSGLGELAVVGDIEFRA